MKFLETFYEWLTDLFSSVKVSPFVRQLATQIEERPFDFQVDLLPGYTGMKVRYLAEPPKGADLDLFAHGFGVDVNFVTEAITIVTYYFDDTVLNKREHKVMLQALNALLDAFGDAAKLADTSHGVGAYDSQEAFDEAVKNGEARPIETSSAP